MELTRVVYGKSTMAKSMIFEGGGEERVPIDFAFFLLRLDERVILVDVGCDTMKGFPMEDFIGPVEALRRLGVSPDSVTDAIITHAHGDHMEGLRHFPGIRVYIQQEECKKGQKHIRPDQTVVTFDRELTIAAGVRVVTIGGHSIGSCVVELEGKTVLCGDECYARYNLEQGVPTASSCDREKSRQFIERYAESWECLLCHQ